MGMYDTIWFNCPNCGEKIFEQSKAGDCILKDYMAKDGVPDYIAKDLDGDIVYCPKCNKDYVMKSSNKVIMRLEEA